jgi:hypothetical protein
MVRTFVIVSVQIERKLFALWLTSPNEVTLRH